MQREAVSVKWQDFAGFLQQLRLRRGLSQDRLAQLLRCSRIHIWRLEHCKRYPSGILLQLIRERCVPADHEDEMLRAFEYLHEFHLQRIELDAIPDTVRDHRI